jgi:hypothetical protein
MRSITCPTWPGKVRWVSSEVTIITPKACGTVQRAAPFLAGTGPFPAPITALAHGAPRPRAGVYVLQ